MLYNKFFKNGKMLIIEALIGVQQTILNKRETKVILRMTILMVFYMPFLSIVYNYVNLWLNIGEDQSVKLVKEYCRAFSQIVASETSPELHQSARHLVEAMKYILETFLKISFDIMNFINIVFVKHFAPLWSLLMIMLLFIVSHLRIHQRLETSIGILSILSEVIMLFTLVYLYLGVAQPLGLDWVSLPYDIEGVLQSLYRFDVYVMSLIECVIASVTLGLGSYFAEIELKSLGRFIMAVQVSYCFFLLILLNNSEIRNEIARRVRVVVLRIVG